MITEVQTYAYDIRDAFFNLVVANPYFADFTCRKSIMLPVQQNLIPYLGVYYIGTRWTSDGDANQGCVKFSHTTRIGFSVVIANSTMDVAEQKADQAFQKILTIAYTDPHLMNPLSNNNPEGVKIRSITGGNDQGRYGSPSTDNETPFVERQYEISCFYRTEWFPDITDTLNEIDVSTGVKPGDTPDEMANRQQVKIVYTLPPPSQRRAPLAKPWLPARDQNRRFNNG